MKNEKINWEKELREEYKRQYGKRAYNAFVTHSPRNGGGTIHLLIAQGNAVELYS